MTMRIFVIAPVIAPRGDIARIELLRRRHDANATRVAAHLTLVFGLEGVDRRVVDAHVARMASQNRQIAYRLSSYLAVPDIDQTQHSIFLVPDQGRLEIEALHDALYSGPLKGYLRRDIPYIPHVTIGQVEHGIQAEALIRTLGQVGISAQLSHLELVEFDGTVLNVLNRFALTP